MPRRRTDRLMELSGFRLLLRHWQFDTTESVLTAPRERLAELHHRHGEVVALVKAGDPDVMWALFMPNDPLDWHVAAIGTDPGARLLAVSRGFDRVASSHYRIDDGSDERRAWATLRSAVASESRPAAPRPARTVDSRPALYPVVHRSHGAVLTVSR
jgi:hypothetical protein